jgi:hypothetical protein
MSYLLNSLQDRAVGYWSFSGNLNDSTSGSNTGTGTAYFTSPPLIANGGSAMRVNSQTSVVINSGSKYAWLTQNTINSAFTFSLWFSFNNQMIGSNYGAGIYKNDQLNIFYVKNYANLWTRYSDYVVGSIVTYNGDNYQCISPRTPTTQTPVADTTHWIFVNNVVAKIYYDYPTNTIRFSVPGTSGTNTEAYYVVNNYDTQFYIMVSYSNNSININVNGETGVSGTIYDLPNNDYNNYKYVIDGSSLVTETVNSSSATNFIVNSLEFQTYLLEKYQISKKYLWGFNDGKPSYQAKINSDTALFNFEESNDSQGYTFYYEGNNFLPNNNILMDNLIVSQNGLKPLKINSASVFNKNTITENGIDFLNGGSVVWSDFGQYSNINNNLIISAQISRSIPSHEYIFYIDNVNYFCDLYLEYDGTVAGSSKYLLNYKNNSTGSVTVLSSLMVGASVTSANIALLFSPSSINLYTSETSASSTYTGTPISGPSISLPLYNSKSSILYIGNYDGSLIFTSKIKNIGITNYSFPGISAFDFTSASTFLIKMTSSSDPTIVSQHGYWKTNIPTIVARKIVQYGTQVDWVGMDSAKVSISTNSGSTYYLVNRGTSISNYNPNLTPRGIMINVDIYTDYSVNDYTQSFNKLKVELYSSLEFFSESYPYRIFPLNQSSNNYVPKNYPEHNYLKRSNNFGIKFTGASLTPAIIAVPGGINYYGVDFWYRADSLYSGSGLRSNLVKNPSFELGTSYWAVNGTTKVSTTLSLFGASAMISQSTANNTIATITTGTNSTATVGFPITPSAYYTFSAYIKNLNAPGGSITARIREYNSSGSIIVTTASTFITSTSSWTRIYATTLTNSNTASILTAIYNASATPTAGTQVYITDGVLLEQSSVVGDYFDGSFNTASWVSGSYTSTSQIYNFNYILSNSSSILSGPAIFLDGNNNLRSLGGTLYVNGASVNDGSYNIIQYEPYHLFLLLSSSYSNNLYLNGSTATSSVPNPSTYGELQFWNNSAVSINTPSTRYLSFVDIPKTSINDNNSTVYTDYVIVGKIGI